MTNALWHIEHYQGPWNTVVDIGAFIGEFSIAAARKGAKVFAYEASPGNYEFLTNNPEFHENITAYNLAVVGQENGVYFSAGYGPTAKCRPYIDGLEVQTITLEAIISALAPIDFLKIDIEGGEHEMFSRRDRIGPMLEHVRFLQLEIHPMDGFNSMMPNYRIHIDELIDFLRLCGFKDRPCLRRMQHAGDFCSHNHRFNGGRSE